MPSYANALWQLLLLLAVACSTPALAITPTELCPPVTIAASSNVTDLTPLTFQGRIADGRVWFVEFYADWCRGCKRIASHVSMLADALAETHPHIAVARVNCGLAEEFCEQVIRITKTPCFKVYYGGKKQLDYNADFYFFDMMHGFIVDVAANIKGFSLPNQQPQPSSNDGDSSEDEDDGYE